MKAIEVTHDTVYLQYKHADAEPLGKPLYETIDWLALAKQKLELLRVIDRTSTPRGKNTTDAPDHSLDGLVYLIDAIQEDAEAQGYPVVWAHDLDSWLNNELDDTE